MNNLEDKIASLYVEISFKFDEAGLRSILEDIKASIKPIVIPLVYKAPEGIQNGYPKNPSEIPQPTPYWADITEEERRIAVDQENILQQQNKTASQIEMNTPSQREEYMMEDQPKTQKSSSFSRGLGEMAIFGAEAMAIYGGVELGRKSIEYNNLLAGIKASSKNEDQYASMKSLIESLAFTTGQSITSVAEAVRPAMLSMSNQNVSFDMQEKYISTMTKALGSQMASGNVSKAIWQDTMRDFIDAPKVSLSRTLRTDLGTEFGNFLKDLQATPELKGMTEKQMQKALSKMTAEQRIQVLIEALERFAAAIDKIHSLGKSTTQLTNSFILLGNSMVDLISVGGIVPGIITRIAKNISALAYDLEFIIDHPKEAVRQVFDRGISPKVYGNRGKDNPFEDVLQYAIKNIMNHNRDQSKNNNGNSKPPQINIQITNATGNAVSVKTPTTQAKTINSRGSTFLYDSH